jgi:hypothetical protein
MQYIERYTPEQARRHEVKCGITGWAQVNGRNCISWENKFGYDVEYVDKISFGLDFVIASIINFEAYGKAVFSNANAQQPRAASIRGCLNFRAMWIKNPSAVFGMTSVLLEDILY